MKKRTLWILGAIVLIAIPTSYFAYAATLGVTSSKITVHRQGATIAVPSPSPSAAPVPTADPTPTATASKTCTLSASQDSFVDDGNAKTNFGTSAQLYVRAEKGKFKKRGFIRFDVASCAIPASATVTSASLQLTSATAPPSARSYVIHRVTASWAEGSVTSQNQPAVAATSSGSATSGASGSVLTWTVTADTAAFAKTLSSNFGWRISDSDENPSAAVEGTFHSREAGTASVRPTLVINYTS